MGKRGPKQQFTDVACPNHDCPMYCLTGRGNVVGNGTYYAGGEKVRKFLCKECGRTFNSRTGTTYEGLRTETKKVDIAIDALLRGKSVREAAEISGCNQSTVRRWMDNGELTALRKGYPLLGAFTGKRVGTGEDVITDLDRRLYSINLPKSLLYFPVKMAKCLRNMISIYTEEIDIKPHQVPLIMEIGTHPGVSQKDLSATLPVDKSRISMVVKDLTDTGIVVNESNSKVGSLILTEKGQNIYKACEAITDRTFARVFESFSRAELEDIEKYTARINKRIDLLSQEFSDKKDSIVRERNSGGKAE